jgi:organic hydroperoxide reductase OsmC/OhrA
LTLQDVRAQVRTTYEQEGSFLTGTVHSYPGEMTVELEIDSDEPHEALHRVAQVAHQSCFVEHTLRVPIDVRCVDRVNGVLLDTAD